MLWCECQACPASVPSESLAQSKKTKPSYAIFYRVVAVCKGRSCRSTHARNGHLMAAASSTRGHLHSKTPLPLNPEPIASTPLFPFEKKRPVIEKK